MVNKVIDKVTSIFTIVSASLFAIIVLIVLANIIGRTFFHMPIKGTVEIIQYGVMFCAGIVMCRSGYEERHISVTLLIDKYPMRLRAAFVALGKLLGTIAFGALAVIYANNVPEALASGKVTETFRLPFEFIYIIMAVCFLVGALIFFYQFCVTMVTVIRGKQGPEKSVPK
ncbi:MAG: TRAP transporter small permease [Peptococcaceae bacterium]|nr:TRAP transporter small permease [Peptococcaceae bacterium]